MKKKKAPAAKPVESPERKRSPEFKTVEEWFPNKVSSAKLTGDNALNGCVPATLITLEKGQFFSKFGWAMYGDWALLGWTTPPYRSEENDAIVFEKLTPANPGGTFYEQEEPGIYWLHGNSKTMKFSNV